MAEERKPFGAMTAEAIYAIAEQSAKKALDH
jgi:hypothetical protein